MKKIIAFCVLLFGLYACKNESQLEKDIAKVDVDFKIERFDLAFAQATPEGLPNLKQTFPFLFSKYENDSIWIDRMNDTLQQQLSNEVKKEFNEFDDIYVDIRSLFQHLKYYDPTFSEPRIITVTSEVDYRYKTIVTDTIVLISLDTYLGSKHEFYEGIPNYIVQNMNRSQIVPDLAANYASNYIFQSQRKTLLDEMIYFGKELYFKDRMIPFKSDAEKIGYTQEQLNWANDNESYIWRYFVEKEMLYSTDNALPNRFIAPAPFSKFYLELDSESPGRLGQYIGWQIIRAYMENNDVPLMDMLQKDAVEIFNNSKFKPRK
ncbi:MAG: gliding motility lipoprotein GldB [Gelidibacter sp.]|nr:gliding motility lipoprotein GldB [Gelidibacter sp.]